MALPRAPRPAPAALLATDGTLVDPSAEAERIWTLDDIGRRPDHERRALIVLRLIGWTTAPPCPRLDDLYGEGNTMRIVGAGLPRTGTHSQKLALERLLGAPCYHMSEVFEHLDHVSTWHAAVRGETVDWRLVLGGYAAIVDWPGSFLWRRLATAYPDALVLLSTRSDAATWLASARATVLDNSPENKMEDDPSLPGFEAMLRDIIPSFEPNWRDDDALLAAYDRHNDEVRRLVPPDRLVQWQPGDGWQPLCEALGVAVPEEPFPHVNTREQFHGRPD